MSKEDWTDFLTTEELNFERGDKMNQTEKILKQLIEDIDLAIIKAKAQLEYVEVK